MLSPAQFQSSSNVRRGPFSTGPKDDGKASLKHMMQEIAHFIWVAPRSILVRQRGGPSSEISCAPLGPAKRIQ
jgi:hypothetical protein